MNSFLTGSTKSFGEEAEFWDASPKVTDFGLVILLSDIQQRKELLCAIRTKDYIIDDHHPRSQPTKPRVEAFQELSLLQDTGSTCCF